MDTSKLETQPIHKEKQEQTEVHTNNEENVMNQEKVNNIEEQNGNQ